MKQLEKLTRDEKSLILFLETQAVDYCGIVRTIHMNQPDLKIAEKWNDEGFIVFHRRPWHEIESDPEYLQKFQRTHYVILSDEAWTIAHVLRKLRGESNLFTKRDLKTDEHQK